MQKKAKVLAGLSLGEGLDRLVTPLQRPPAERLQKCKQSDLLAALSVLFLS